MGFEGIGNYGYGWIGGRTDFALDYFSGAGNGLCKTFMSNEHSRNDITSLLTVWS